MSKGTIVANWNPMLHHEFGLKVSAGDFRVKVQPFYRDILDKILKEVNQKQNEKGECYDIKITIQPYYKKRSLDQNALYWSLLTILANEMNGGRIGPEMIKPEKVHEDLLEQYGSKAQIHIPAKHLPYICEEYHVMKYSVNEQKETAVVELIIGTRHFDTMQMAEWLNMVFDMCAEYGVTKSKDIMQYWKEWSDFCNQESIMLYDEITDPVEYKEKFKRCQACSAWVGDGSGHIAHIKAKGKGGNPEPWMETGFNWLHLCARCHLQIQHSKGWGVFLETYSHLRKKVERALKKQVGESGRGEVLDQRNTIQQELTGLY